MVVPTHEPKEVMKTCQDHGTLVARIQWLLLSNCLLLLQEVFLKSVLPKYQEIAGEGATGVQMRGTHWGKDPDQGILTCWSSCGTNVC